MIPLPEGLRTEMMRHGLTPPPMIEPGAFRRFPGADKDRHNTAGWLKVRADGSAVFGDLSRDLSESYQPGRDKPLTRAELEAAKRETAEHKAQAEAKKRDAEKRTAERARKRWDEARRAKDDHPYLTAKGVGYHGSGQTGDALLVPMFDPTTGTLHNVQWIGPDGVKRFMRDGRTKGLCFLLDGAAPEGDGVLLLSEGFATAASCREATAYPTACAFTAGNLLPVAEALRGMYPEARIIIAGDHDANGTGQKAAMEAARAVGGLVSIPVTAGRDWNDVHQAEGMDALRAEIEAAREPSAVGADGEKSAVPHVDPAKDTEVHKYGGGAFELRRNGVWFVETDNESKKHETWTCSPLHIAAKTRDGNSHEWGRLLEWLDDDRKAHRWAMPAALLQGDGVELRKELAAGGLHISPGGKARNLLTAYIQTAPVDVRARCVKRLGWHGDAYVTSDSVYGPTAQEAPVFQSDAPAMPEQSMRGTADEWCDNVAALAQGNTRLIFALAVSFGGPLLALAGEDSGGFHYRGSSSTGKTTALRVAASVWGEPTRYVRTWRATTNGLEGIAAIHNDGLLILDELHQCDPKEAGDVAYMLANGQGKARAARTGTAREVLTWRLLFLSSGEQSLAARLATVGKQSTAGQEVRLADIPADAGRGMGIIEELHGMASSGELVTRLAEGYGQFYGTVGREWLRLLARDRQELVPALRDNLDALAREIADGADATGQSLRVARRFALAAVAGDLATRYGLIAWPEDEALNAAKACFRAWLDGFGTGGNREERMLLAQVRQCLEAHGASRFEPYGGADPDRGPIIRDRLGFTKRNETGGIEYLVLPEQFRTEVVKGTDLKWAATVLAAHGYLRTQADRATCMERIPALGSAPRRVYVLTRRAAGEET